jgi:hypothetical protein
MKKLIFTLAFIFGMGIKAWAVADNVWLSSNTAVNNSTTTLCGTINYLVGTSTYTQVLHGVLHGVCINTAAAGNIQIFNSSATAVNSVTGVLSTATQEPCNFYDVAMSSGITYNKNGTADISILYSCY